MVRSFKPFALACVTLASCGGGGGDRPATPAPAATAWQAGPTIIGKNYSAGTTLTETVDGLTVEIPQQGAGSANYITEPMSLAGKTCIDMHYRVEVDSGTSILPVTGPALPSMLSLYFQRAGDDWSAKGAFEAYRWYSPEVDMPITAGDHEIKSCFDENWTAVETSSATGNPAAFAAAIANASTVGFVLGGGTGRGHGVYAVGGSARIVVADFEALP